MKLKKKLIGLILSMAMVVTMAVPFASFADEGSAYQAPTEAMAVDDNIVKVGIHAAASTTSFFLGGNVVAERASDYRSITSAEGAAAKLQAAMTFTRLGAFGSSSNINPDPYLWNYFYNLAVDAGAATGPKAEDEVFISSVGSPMQSDTTVVDELGTSYTLYRRPEILMDTAGGYDALIAELPENKDLDPDNDYAPISLSYKANNFADLVSDMYTLAEAIKKSGKGGRYGDPYPIAQDYEKFMKGIQLYIISKIEDGTVAKKKVAVIDTSATKDADNDGIPDSYKLVDNTVSIGTSTDRPSESIMYVSDNMYTDDTAKKEADGSDFYATAADILNYADVIIQAGHGSLKENAIRTNFKRATGNKLADRIPIYATDPSDVFTIRANSVENFIGVGIFGGYLYPEIVNPIYTTMYVYETFWHLNQDALEPFANANFANASLPDGIDPSGDGYKKADIEEMIATGLQYYADHPDDFIDTTLEITDNIDLPESQTKPIDDAVVTVENTTYTGKAATPAVTATLDGVYLAEDRDYKAIYSDNTDVGTATVIVKGIGKYRGRASATFEIKQADISTASVTASKAVYTGKALTPAVTVKFNGATLNKNTDYTVKYANNTKAGTATVTVTGKGNYAGTATGSFSITKAKNPLTEQRRPIRLLRSRKKLALSKPLQYQRTKVKSLIPLNLQIPSQRKH